MWQRFVRFLRSLFGGMLESVEDPELILKQSIRDMRDKLPKINENMAKMKGGLILLDQEVKQSESDEQKLIARVKAALEGGDEQLAADYALRLKQTQDGKGRSKEQFDKASEAYSKAVEFKQDYVREMNNKIKEAELTMREHEASKWKAEVAQVFETFEVGDIDGTVDEMMQKLRTKTAMQEGKLEMAMDTVQMKDSQLDKRADQLQAQELLRQFKVEWGMESKDISSSGSGGGTPTAQKTVGPAEVEQAPPTSSS